MSTSTTETINQTFSPKKSSIITDAALNPQSAQPQEVNYREEVTSLFFNSLLEYIVQDYNVTTEINRAETLEAHKATEVKDFKDLSREDLQHSQILNVSGSKVSLSQRSKRSSESKESIKLTRRSKLNQEKGKRTTLSTTDPDDVSLKRLNASKSGRRVSTITSFSTILEDAVTSTADEWFVNTAIEEVTIHFKNGNFYKGSVLKKRFHGYGVFMWSDGTVYEGEFEDGYLSGKGRLVYNDNSYYIGNFCKGLIHGEGCLYVSSTSMLYSGNWKGGKKNGIISNLKKAQHNNCFDTQCLHQMYINTNINVRLMKTLCVETIVIFNS